MELHSRVLRFYIIALRSKLTHLSSPQLEVGHGKKAIVIFVPVPLLPGFHKVQQRYALPPPTPLLPTPTNPPPPA